MIKVNSLNKYYNKNKSNGLHVIDNTTLELPSSGLVAFLGKSGSGKTTLLNVIGGLDKFNSGSISYDEETISSYNMTKADRYRKNHVGYIFQNYLLLEERSVYDNLRIALETNGITDEEEQQKRIKYVLDCVGLYKFRKKHAGNLSGGQMQRVSIARALLKECKVIIADEPTGNLDSENTIDVMNILKKISQKTLVLLVTHNREIAEFYGDRVVEISDGKIISDHAGDMDGVSGSDFLDIKREKKVYLKDLQKQETKTEDECLKVNFYTDAKTPNGEDGATSTPKCDTDKSIEINIVVKGGTVYLQSTDNLVVVKDGNVELIDDHYQAISQDDVDNFDFDISWYNNAKQKSKLKSFWRAFKSALASFWFVPKKKRVFQFIFAFIGIIMGVCVISISTYNSFDASYELKENNIYRLANKDSQFDTYRYPNLTKGRVEKAVEDGIIKTAYTSELISLNITYVYNTVRSIQKGLECYPYPYVEIEKTSTLLAGSKPTKNAEIVLGKTLADKFVKELNLSSYDDLIGKTASTNTYYSANKYTICGVANTQTNGFYTHFLSKFGNSMSEKELLSNVAHTSFFEYEIDEGDPEHELGKGEMLISTKYKSLLDYGNEIEVMSVVYGDIYGKDYWGGAETTETYEIVGTFTPPVGYEDYDIIMSDTRFLGTHFSMNGKYLVADIYHNSFTIYSSSTLTEAQIDKTFNPNSRLSNSSQCEAVVHPFAGYNLGDELYTGSGIIVVGFYKANAEIDKDIAYLTDKALFNATCDYLENNYGYYDMSGIARAYYIIEPNDLPKLADYYLKYYDVEEYAKLYYKYGEGTDKIGSLVLAIVLLVFIMVYVYFSTRSRMISQIKSLGIYRCIGANRWQIHKKYGAEILVETSFTTLIDYVLTILCHTIFVSKISVFLPTVKMANIGFVLLGVIAIYAVNLLFGLLPVFMLLRKTPAEINSKYDI